MCRKLILFVLVLALAGTNVVLGGRVIEIGIVNGNDSVEDQLDRGMYMDSSDLELPNDGGLQVIGLRFLNVEVPKGANIVEAYVVFTVDETTGPEAVNLIIDGELVPDAPAFADVMYNVTDRTRTAAQVDWQPEAWPATGVKKQTSDISAVIQEIISQEGWAGGNALAIIISDNPDNPSKGNRVAVSGAGGNVTMLHIEFSSKRAIVPDPADSAMYEDTWASLSWTPGETAATHDVYFSDNLADVEASAESAFLGNQSGAFFVVGFPGMPFPDGLVPGTTYYWRIDEIESDDTTKHKGFVWSFMVPPKTAYKPDPADSAELVDLDVKLSWTGGFRAKLHTVYFGDNFDDVSNATGGLPQGAATYIPRGPLKLAKTYYWRVDEFDPPATYKGDVWSFTTQGGVGSPNPSNGAVDVKQTQILTWSPGVYAASHQVYFGTDKEVVRNANTGSPEYKGSRNLGAESYDPGKLLWDATYYWRIDEVNNVNADSPWKGPVWSFTTANFLVVDDFEDYDVGNNEIWWSWKDGLGYGTPGTQPYSPGNGTGSAVGDENTASYTEETIVHGGSQSMPLFYDNSVLKYSEVEKTLTYPRDWTENGVNTLTIWFRGDSANAAETLYIVLNGSAVVTHDNPNAAQIDKWTQWNIDLQAFGVNLANVNTIALGLGNKKNPVAGGSGTMYFDDIRLYPPPPVPAP